MTNHKKILGLFGAAAFTAAAAFSAYAQDEAAPAEDAAAEGAAEDGGEAPAVEVKPRPAEKMPLTPKGLLLDVVRNNGAFIAVGDRGGIILSKDGQNWEQVEAPVRAALTADPSWLACSALLSGQPVCSPYRLTHAPYRLHPPRPLPWRSD
jgi:hypothetical protein